MYWVDEYLVAFQKEYFGKNRCCEIFIKAGNL